MLSLFAYPCHWVRSASGRDLFELGDKGESLRREERGIAIGMLLILCAEVEAKRGRLAWSEEESESS